ncbi:MAG: MotA/TolQ/ExbB proton channel family protein [Nitrospinae bacterium]|nr:MotA/TolQ/ExbB proton channel family protein [Nitrospinota bacterium]
MATAVKENEAVQEMPLGDVRTAPPTGMDMGTIWGSLIGTILIVIAILMGGDWVVFLNFHSFLLVFGGTIATTFMAFSSKKIMVLLGVTINAFKPDVRQPADYIDEIMSLSNKYRAGGMKRLEQEESLIDNRFLKNGVGMIVDGYNAREIHEIMERELTALGDRHNEGQKILRFMAVQAPVFGMVGTVMGMIQMLQQLSDPSRIGPNMALALTATFYGLLLNNFAITPIVAKLANRTESEKMLAKTIRVGVIGIHDRINPQKIQRNMNSLLPPELQR